MKIVGKEFGFKYFLKPTPKNIAKLGWSLFITCQTAAGAFIYFEKDNVAIYIGITGFVGLFLSNFFGNGTITNQEGIQ